MLVILQNQRTNQINNHNSCLTILSPINVSETFSNIFLKHALRAITKRAYNYLKLCSINCEEKMRSNEIKEELVRIQADGRFIFRQVGTGEF